MIVAVIFVCFGYKWVSATVIGMLGIFGTATFIKDKKESITISKKRLDDLKQHEVKLNANYKKRNKDIDNMSDDDIDNEYKRR